MDICDKIISSIKSKDSNEICSGLNDLLKKTNDQQFKKIFLSIDLIDIFTSKENITNKKVCNYLPDLLTKANILLSLIHI